MCYQVLYIAQGTLVGEVGIASLNVQCITVATLKNTIVWDISHKFHTQVVYIIFLFAVN